MLKEIFSFTNQINAVTCLLSIYSTHSKISFFDNFPHFLHNVTSCHLQSFFYLIFVYCIERKKRLLTNLASNELAICKVYPVTFIIIITDLVSGIGFKLDTFILRPHFFLFVRIGYTWRISMYGEKCGNWKK